MAVAFSSASTNGGSGSITQPHTCGGSDRILIVAFCDWIGVDTNILTVNPKYNGVDMTQHATHAFNTGRAEFWYLINPDSGTHDITYSNSGPSAMNAASFNGVDTGGPFGTVQAATGGSATPTSASIVIPTDDMWVDVLGILCGAGCTANGSFTQSGSVAPCNPKGQMAYRVGDGSAFQHVWTGYVQDTRWADVAIQLKAPSTAIVPQLAAVGVGR